MMTKKEAAEAVRAAKARLKVTWAQLAEARSTSASTSPERPIPQATGSS